MKFEDMGFPLSHRLGNRIFIAYEGCYFGKKTLKGMSYIHPKRKGKRVYYDVVFYIEGNPQYTFMKADCPNLKYVKTLVERHLFRYWVPACGYDLSRAYVMNREWHDMMCALLGPKESL